MTPVPAMLGTIERRLLLNCRVDSAVLERYLSPPFRPKLVDGIGMAGICLIRLGKLRPSGFPELLGLKTENAAHRVAVEWDGPEGRCQGVYIPRRDTSSRLTVLLGGRLFPGEHHRARFRVLETPDRYEVAFQSSDGSAHVSIAAVSAPNLARESVFTSLDDASQFFEKAPVGYSETRRGHFEGLELHTSRWHVDPVRVEHVVSSFFTDESIFPADSAEFDSALVMRDLPVAWSAKEPIEGPATPLAPDRVQSQEKLV